MINKKSTSLFLILLILACSPSSRVTITNINDLASISANDYMYSLPLSRISIEITAIRHLTIPGPYNVYAEKYLGFTGVPSISKTDWELYDIQLSSIAEPDPEYCFAIEMKPSEFLVEELSKLSTYGLVIASDNYYSFSRFYPFFGDKPEPFHFPDLSVKPNIERGAQKSSVKRDSGNLSGEFSSGKHEDGLKSIDQKSEEAANFIFKLRKRRFKLLAGKDTILPDGVALQTSIKELDDLEKEYLSLFIGKTYSDTLHRVFFYTPKASQEIERNVVCRFSDETGFLDESGNSGTPLILELRNMKITEAMKNLQMPYSGPTFTNVLLYRIPDKASVHIFYGSATVLEAEVKVFQYGPIITKSIQ
jgi:hypothetical protein